MKTEETLYRLQVNSAMGALIPYILLLVLVHGLALDSTNPNNNKYVFEAR